MQLDWKNVNFKSLAIIGATRTGKTGLGYFICEAFPTTDKYVFMHPKPELVEPLGFKQCYGEAEIEKMHDCILWIDEPQLYSSLNEGKENKWLLKLLSLCGQRNIKLIISTSDTRFITRGLESYMEVWCVKDIELDLVKQGSMVKKIIRENCFITTRGFRLETDEYIFYSRNFKQYNGKHTFNKPIYFTEELSKPYHDIITAKIDSEGKCDRNNESASERQGLCEFRR